MATMRPTPRNELLGLLSDAYQWMQSPERTQQMQGFAGLLGTTGLPQTVERMAYGEPLTNIGAANVPLLKPETADALMTVAPIAKPAAVMAGRTGRAVGRMAGEEINAAMIGQPTRSLLGQITPKPLRMSDTSYRGSHTAPGPDFGAPLYDLSQMYPADVYSEKAAQYYGSGNKRADIEAFNLAKRVRGNPDAEVTIYRAVPKNADISNINAGDWVTLTKDYAKGHGESVLRGDYKILSQKVKAKDLWTNADSIQEFGYQPQKLNAPQQAALDLAQERAALPVEQGGLGLPANNTAADRAKALGWDTNVLHGSPNPNIQQFDPMMAGANTSNAFDNNIFATTSPESAMGYSLNWKQYRNEIKTSPEYKAITREENALLKDLLAYKESGNDKGVADVEAKMDVLAQQRENIYNDFLAGKLGSQGSTIYPLMVRSQDFFPYEASGSGWMRANRPAIDAAEAAGYSGALIKNVKDNAGANLGSIADVYATPDPTRFRSRFAAFDPFRKDVATATAMGVALPDLLAAELPEEELKRNQSAGLLFP